MKLLILFQEKFMMKTKKGKKIPRKINIKRIVLSFYKTFTFQI